MHFSTKDILQPIHTTWLPEHIQAAMLRLDQLDPLVSGNKWFKLKYNLEAAVGKPIVTFGGAWSNHILATAAACRMKGLTCTGIIRGERPMILSTTLEQAGSMGMRLVFVSREVYQQLTDTDIGADDYMYALHQLSDNIIPPDAYVIPEGGHNALGVKGCSEILSLADTKDFTHVICSVGTGTTLAGLINSTVEGSENIVEEVLHDLAQLVTGDPGHEVQKVIGISALKGAFSLKEQIESLLISSGPWELVHDFHEGGYGKISPELISL